VIPSVIPRSKRQGPSRAIAWAALALAICLPTSGEASDAELPSTDVLRSWIVEMKSAPRGPFERLRWFCADGTVHPPKPYPCADRGDGIQHGEWSDQVKIMRAGGYAIANVLADLDAQDFVGEDAQTELLKQILMDRFLIGWDNGWIFRAARSYRGALQSEDEEAGASAVVMAMLADPLWRQPARFFLVREAVRLLPVRTEEGVATEVRHLALQIADADKNFMDLRVKIHNVPDPEDAARVRTYAEEQGIPKLAEQYELLATRVDELYSTSSATSIGALADKLGDSPLAAELRSAANKLEESQTPGQRLAHATRLLGKLRDVFAGVANPEIALAVLETSLSLEDEAYAAGAALAGMAGTIPRNQQLWLLEYTAQSLYGAGFLTRRHVEGVSAAVQRLESTAELRLSDYRRELRYLARVPEWCDRWIAFNIGRTVENWLPIEPLVHMYSQDRLRSSPLLFYSAVIDGLVLDADQLAGLRHEVFDQAIGTGLRALNPGFARGIYMLPETTSHLPRVKGILTEGEGSSLSHIQLLARNLGIPNVVVGRELLPMVRERSGEDVVLAVSPGGVVELSEYSSRWDEIFGAAENPEHKLVIRPDLEKLDVDRLDLLPLSTLRATDSGRTSGPKGANLGELKFAFGDIVPSGFVIPFGVFRHLLDAPIEAGGPSVFEWMKSTYDDIEAAKGNPEKQAKMVSSFLSKLRGWLHEIPLPADFESALRMQLNTTFGVDGSYGVFVRSDTNVEDLPGFTGAGLNLTVFNVVGYDNIIAALRDVWASPFEERAYGWRQENMQDPEYVFPAVVVQRAVPSEKSGVMVTADVEGGSMDWLSVAVNEGVGGAVDGQASESLRINIHTGETQFLAQATAPTRAALGPKGGIVHPSASGTTAVLTKAEIAQLINLALEVPKRFDTLREEDGSPVPADIEFAFLRGRLVLLQIRPFVENKGAQSNAYLVSLDAGLAAMGQRSVDLSGVPGAAPQPQGETQ